MKVLFPTIQIVVQDMILPEFKNGTGMVQYIVKFDCAGKEAYLIASDTAKSVEELVAAVKEISEEYELSYYEQELKTA